MKIDELNLFLNEMLSASEYFTPKNPRIIDYVKLIDPAELFWHVEGISIWPIKNWERSLEYREIRRRKEAENNFKVEQNKIIIDDLKRSIMKELHIDEELAFVLAVEFRKKNPGAAKYFGVDVSQAPAIEKPHLIINNGKYIDIGGTK